MTLDELYNLSREESFERIKDESRSQAKWRLCASLICFLIFIATLISMKIWRYQELDRIDTIYACLLLVYCFAAGWIAVNNLRFLKRVDSLDTPEQLLHCYEKTINHSRKAAILAIIVSIGDPYVFLHDDRLWVLLNVTITLAIIAFLIYTFFKDYWAYKTRRDEEIIDRLQDLIDMK